MGDSKLVLLQDACEQRYEQDDIFLELHYF